MQIFSLQFLSKLTARQCVIMLLVTIFVAELGVMFVLPYLFASLNMPRLEAVVDSSLLTLIVAPVIWHLIIHPLQDAVINEQKHMATILNECAGGIVTIDERGMIESYNIAAQNIFGYLPDEVIGHNVSMLMPSPYHESHDGYLSNYLNGGERKIIGMRREVTGLRKDQTTFPMELHVSEAVFQDRRIFTGIVMDITDRKKTEAELKLYSEALERANQSLEDVNETAMASTRAKSEFLANMSHEIRTPMTAILGFTEQLGDPQLADAQRKDMVETVQRNGQHLLILINDILDLSKIESGGMDVERIECSPVQIVGDVVSLMHLRAESKKLTLKATFNGKIPDRIYSDPTRIRQILINLVGNAIKFTRTGTITMETRLIADAQGKSALQIDVKDTGIGMTKEQTAKLFAPFTQGDSSHTRNYGGTGLGLTLSQRFANMLGGEVTLAKTQLGVGSQFRVLLDLGDIDQAHLIDPQAHMTDPNDIVAVENAQTQPIAQGEAAQDDSIPCHCRVLIVEDCEDNQKLLSHILEKSGATVTVANNGQTGEVRAIQAWENENPFDVILMDIQMPVMDGYEATRQLREKGYPGPIIALTAHAMSGDREKCLQAGCDEYTTKPINRNELIKLISRVIDTANTTTVSH